MIELKIRDGGENWVYRMGDRDKVLIGRAPTNDIQIREQRSSRVHCHIERTGGGYKLVDLESRNGTRVNDATVNSKVLEPGDKIQIGQMVIQFGEPAPVPVPTPPPAPSARPELSLDEKKEEAPAMQTLRLEKRPSHHRMAAPARRRSSMPWEILLIGGGVLVALVLGTFIYNWANASQERKNALKKADQVWEQVKVEMDLPSRLARMKEAIDQYKTLSRLYPDSAEGAAAEAQLKRIEPEYRNLAGWQKSYSSIVQARKMAGDAADLDQLMYWEDKLKKIESDSPFGVLSAQAGLERDAIVRSLETAAMRLLAEQRKDLEVQLAAEDYAGVLMRWELFKERYSRFPDLAKAVEGEIQAVLGKVDTSLKALSGRVDLLLEEKRYTEARALLDRARERYLGTEAAAQVAMKAQVIRLMAQGKEDRGKAEEIVESRKQFYLSAAEADTHAKRREFAKAAQIYRDIIAGTDDPDVKAEFGRRVGELESIHGLFTAFIRKASSGALKDKKWALGPGTIVLVDTADQEWVHFQLSGRSGSTQKRWKVFTAKELVNLLRLANDDAKGLFTIAQFCFRNKLEETGERILTEVAGKEASFQSRIDDVIARVRGVAVPAGGFVVFKGRWYTLGERERAVEDAKIARLIKTILKKPVAEISGAVGRLSAMKRGREPLVKALHDKREILKKKMGRDLRFDNATLITLKNELDKRRCEALDFIEDKSRYPDKKKMEASGRMGEYWKIQKEEVDTRVKAVREIWKNPYSAAMKLNPAAKTLNKDLKKVNEWLAKEDKTFDPKKADSVDMDYIASLAANKLNIKTFAIKSKEQKLITYNLTVMEWNGKNKTATSVEIKQVEITNEYRFMLGRRCVKIEDFLVNAARGHSEHMTKTGKFAHSIPGEPNGETPQERCKNAGYTSGTTGENISYNHTDPQGTFVAWYNSSGHHRNMISRNWVVLGAGFDGPHWTQNFGSNDSTTRHKDSPGLCSWPGLEWRGGKAKRKG